MRRTDLLNRYNRGPRTLQYHLKFDDRQFYRESFEIIFNNDVAFGYKLVPVVQVTQSDAGCGCGIGPEVDHILHDGIVGADGYVDG